ncbi:packaged DNA stabilization gp4 family protein [Vibrio fluvialis]|uniref:packaged DNA stabilization gp4 family protein n=1 Tax=Vibrio fluvialis TaxID=676 RepID=UPI001F28AC07|nr:packaged DNA stabilization gp4 family protein [Vibrio fluvialis]MCE7614201.1 packaged DNA stabilization gp4 family protein [Vibrio fluvialis]
MLMTTKGDLVRAALRKLGVASNATLTDVEPQSMEDAVNDLESMMAEWYDDGSGIDVGYLFSDSGNPPADADDHGLPESAISAVYHNLAIRISPDYEINPSQKVVTTARNGKEKLIGKSVLSKTKKAPYPSRMPIGSGNSNATVNDWHYFPGEE